VALIGGLELEAALPSGVTESLNTAVILIGATIQDDLLDAGV